jgi:hypothetical protein
VHLASLWTLAFVQPLFDILGKNAAFFVARDNTAGDVLIFAFAWALGPPLIATLLVGLVRAVSERAGRLLQLGLVTVLAGVLMLQIIKGVSADAKVVLPLALLLGAAVAAAYARFEGLRSFLSILGVAPVVVLALLLLFSPVKDVAFPSDEAVAAGAKAKNPVPVVVMIFDELPTPSLMKPNHQIDAERYPNFARLAKTSTWYRNATSVSDGTYVAVPAILTGKRPQAELPTSHEYPDNLFTLLGRGYEQHDQEPITSVCPTSLCGERDRAPRGERLKSLASDLGIVERRLLLPKGMAQKLPPIDRDWEDFQADAGNDGLAEAANETAAPDTANSREPIRVAGDDLPAQRVIEGRSVVATMKPGGPKPGLWMVHYVIPHVPWRFLPDGSQYVVEGPTMPGLNDQNWGTNRFLLDQAFQRHLLMLRFGDRLLGDAIDQMQRTGLWDKALVIVVADHGGAVGAKESRRPATKENFPQVASVPFFVKEPGQEDGSVEDSFVTTLDVVPTIAKALEIDTDFDFDGVPVDEPQTAKLLQQRNGREAKLVGVSPEDFVRRRDAELAERARRWPPGLDAIWRNGPRQDLVGGPAPDGAPVDGVSAFLNNAKLYRHVKPTSGVIPAYVTGSTRGIDPGTDLAVAVNGRIEATGEAYIEHGDARFSMLLPPEVLHRGRNDVQVYALDGAKAIPLL